MRLKHHDIVFRFLRTFTSLSSSQGFARYIARDEKLLQSLRLDATSFVLLYRAEKFPNIGVKDLFDAFKLSLSLMLHSFFKFHFFLESQYIYWSPQIIDPVLGTRKLSRGSRIVFESPEVRYSDM